ncbi:MAG: glycosyltransferase family 2 protein, partial [Dysgonomonas sp.]
IDKVKSRTPDHSFYYCPTPDGFSGVVLAGEVDEYAYTNEPLTIGGTTEKSQGKNYRRTDKESIEESKQFFNDNLNKRMHPELASQCYSPLTTLMTADYLLTAKDLPGWPGKFEPISFDALIRASFKLIETSPFEKSVLVRELKILKEIAKQHDLLNLFNTLFSKTKCKTYVNDEVYGFVITNFIRFEGSELGIKNIYDASLATNFVYSFFNSISIKSFVFFMKNSYKILIRSKIYKREKLPNINEI